AGARGAELRLGPFGERLGTRTVSGVESLTEQLAGFGAVIAATEERAEVGQGARSLQGRIGALERGRRLAEEQRSVVTSGDDAGGAHRDTKRTRGAECARELELFGCKAFRRFLVAEHEMGERSLGPPGDPARGGDHGTRQAQP